MNFVFFTHSISSDWNNGHVHFLRGVVRSLRALGHRVRVLEPRDGWSVKHAMREEAGLPIKVFRTDFPDITPEAYDASTNRLEDWVDLALRAADVVVVQEWIDPRVAQAIAAHRREHGGYRLFLHDAHHGLLSDPSERHDHLPIEAFDAVLVLGQSLADLYRERTDARQVHVWHEAADTTTFRPLARSVLRDLVWIGNWGDEERTGEIQEFVIGPSQRLRLQTTVHGVRYPPSARRRLEGAGIRFEGWIANSRVPEVFAAHRMTIHVPRGPYVQQLPGIPTIRVFEALACGIPLISAPWSDEERLFHPGDLRFVEDGDEATEAIAEFLQDPAAARAMGRKGRKTVLKRHTCRHRAEELLHIDRCHRDRVQTATVDEPRVRSVAA